MPAKCCIHSSDWQSTSGKLLSTFQGSQLEIEVGSCTAEAHCTIAGRGESSLWEGRLRFLDLPFLDEYMLSTWQVKESKLFVSAQQQSRENAYPINLISDASSRLLKMGRADYHGLGIALCFVTLTAC